MTDTQTTMTYQTAARAIGVSLKTLRRAVDRNELRPTRIGRRVLFRPAEVDRYLASMTRTPVTIEPPISVEEEAQI